jgi:hypothetical protein
MSKYKSCEISEKAIEVAYEIDAEVEFGVGHVLDDLEPAVGLAAGHQCQRVFEGDQGVLLSVDDQYGATDFLAVLFVVEGLFQDHLRAPAIEIFCDLFQGEEGTEKDGAVDWVLLGEGETDCAADGPSEDYHLAGCEFIGKQKGDYSLCIGLDVG